jgi:hypothetical protein
MRDPPGSVADVKEKQHFEDTMQGMSERQYAAHVGLSRGAIQKARRSGRLVLFEDGSMLRGEMNAALA